MAAVGFIVRPTTEADWRQVRDLRLEMLQDSPIAYGETLATAAGHNDAEWRMRGARGQGASGTVLAAIAGNDRWIGTMGVFLPGEVTDPLMAGVPVLVGVYVAPDHRGTEAGVMDALLAGIEGWAASRSDRLALHVHEDNLRAIRAYQKRGFRFTGRHSPYALDASQRELEMVKTIRAA